MIRTLSLKGALPADTKSLVPNTMSDLYAPDLIAPILAAEIC